MVLFGLAAGLFTGTYAVSASGFWGLPPLLASTLKIPIMFLLTVVVCFPSLFVFSALLGSRLRASAVLRLVWANVAVMTVIVASLGPNARTKLVFRVWSLLFGLVGTQSSWLLRPHIGNPESPFQLFRDKKAPSLRGSSMRSASSWVDEPLAHFGPDDLRSTGAVLWAGLGGGAAFGFALGSYASTEGAYNLQPLVSAVKVPLLIAASAALAAPSYLVALLVAGLGDDLAFVRARLRSGLVAFGLVLLGCSPIALVLHGSHSSHPFAVLSAGPFFLLATLMALRELRQGLRALLAARPRHRALLALFGVTFCLVAIQLAWSLRPFVGHPDEPFMIFRPTALTNAYEAVGQLLLRVLRRG